MNLLHERNDGDYEREEIDGYDSTSTGEDEYDVDDSASDEDIGAEDVDISTIGAAKETIFLIGGRSRYGRTVRLNSKFL